MATKPAQTTKIVLAEDCEIFKDGFALLLEKETNNEIRLVSTVSTEEELFYTIKQHKPDVVLTANKLKGINNVRACNLIKSKFPKTSMLLLISEEEEQLIFDVLNAGADGFVSKNAGKEKLVEAIKTVASGSSYYCQTMSGKLLDLITRTKPRKKASSMIEFNDTQRKIIQLICKQYTTKEIADSLRLSDRTVDDYRHKIQEKIGAKNVVGIVLFAIENKLVEVFMNS